MACPLLHLFAKRRHAARSFVFRDALDAPHGKEQIAKTYEWFIVHDSVQPSVECIKIKAAQEYSRLIDLVENAPTFFARALQDDNYCRAATDSGISRQSFVHLFVPRCLRSQARATAL
jgi:hypothetical protein